jgi:hypothetical protein
MPFRSNDSEEDEPIVHDGNSDNGEGNFSVNVDDSITRNDDPDMFRILLSTDNHLGYAERDTVRGMDSFAAFEEVLYLAKRFHCDLVLIAGDLFHENRPSRRTLHKTMEILRRYCMGPDPVKIEIISDTTKTFRSSISGLANYLDPNYAVHLPVFSIHGNHDDPSRDQGGGELLAALGTLLNSCSESLILFMFTRFFLTFRQLQMWLLAIILNQQICWQSPTWYVVVQRAFPVLFLSI